MPILPRFSHFIALLIPATLAFAPAANGAASEVFFADPTIYAEGGKYYLTGTRRNEPAGFAVLVSENLRDWRAPPGASPFFILRAGAGAFGASHFWAPQIVRNDAEYLLTYTADEQIALAKSRTLLGPYRQERAGPVDESERNIDSYLFRDDDGRYYLYHVRFRRGNYLWSAEFDLAAGRIKPATLTRCFEVTQAWEATAVYRSAPIMEGPAVVKLKGRYYLFYSANHYRSIDYAVGYAVADTPTGPWVKYERNPILHRSIVGENGSGHGDVFRGPDGDLYYVYHVHHSGATVSPRRTRIVPLTLTWEEPTRRYKIAVDPSRIIKPTAAVIEAAQ